MQQFLEPIPVHPCQSCFPYMKSPSLLSLQLFLIWQGVESQAYLITTLMHVDFPRSYFSTSVSELFIVHNISFFILPSGFPNMARCEEFGVSHKYLNIWSISPNLFRHTYARAVSRTKFFLLYFSFSSFVILQDVKSLMYLIITSIYVAFPRNNGVSTSDIVLVYKISLFILPWTCRNIQ